MFNFVISIDINSKLAKCPEIKITGFLSFKTERFSLPFTHDMGILFSEII